MPSHKIGARRSNDVAPPSERTTQDPAVSSYLKSLQRRGCAPQTIETYSRILADYGRWLDEQGFHARSVSLGDLETFQVYLARERDLSRSRQGLYVAVLRAFYRLCDQEHLVLSNPAEGLRYPKQTKRLRRDALTPAELKRLLNQAQKKQPWMHVAIRLMALSGLRAGEVMGLDVGDIDLKRREITIRHAKGGKQRLVFIDHSTQPVIAAYLVQHRPITAGAEQAALLVDQRGRRPDRDQVYGAVKRCAKRARINQAIGSHSLRRTFGSLFLNSGVPGANLKVVAELLGHSELGTTAKYTQLDEQVLSNVYRAAHPRASIAVEGGDA